MKPNRHRSIRKRFCSKIKNTYEEFAEKTSVHGIKYTILKECRKSERIFWGFAVISCLFGAVYMTVLFWQRYSSNPTRTTIKTTFAPTTTVSFPAVSICNVNTVLKEKVDALLSEFNSSEEEKQLLANAFGTLPFFQNTFSDKSKFNIDEYDRIQGILKENGYDNITKIVERLSQSCDELLIRCTWDKQDVSCEELFESTYTSHGPCCSFNYLSEKKLKPKYTYLFGLGTGLRVLINPARNYMNDDTLDLIKVLIHNPNDYPGSQSNLKIIASGSLSYLQVLGLKRLCSTEVLNLSTEHRDCIHESEGRLEYFNNPYRGYTVSNCLTQCAALWNYKQCGCVPYYYDFIKGKNYCNMSESLCINALNYDKLECNCPSQCEDVVYNILSTQVQLDLHSNVSMIEYTSGFAVDNRTIWLNVYFMKNTQSILFRDVITSATYLLSSMGGIYSLFIGCSLITIVEVLYYFIYRMGSSFFKHDMSASKRPKDTTTGVDYYRPKCTKY